MVDYAAKSPVLQRLNSRYLSDYSPGFIDPRDRCRQARSQQNASQRIMPLIWPE